MELAYLKLLLVPTALVTWIWARGRSVPWSPWAGMQLVAAFCAESGAILLLMTGQPNTVVYNLYLPVEFGVLSAMVLAIPAPDRDRKRVSVVTALVFVAVLLWELVRIEGRLLDHFLAMSLVTGGFLLAVQGLFAALALANTGSDGTTSRAAWWMLASVCLYFVSCTPVFGLMNHFLRADPVRARALMDINDGLFILRYGLVCMALWILTRTRRQP